MILLQAQAGARAHAHTHNQGQDALSSTASSASIGPSSRTGYWLESLPEGSRGAKGFIWAERGGREVRCRPWPWKDGGHCFTASANRALSDMPTYNLTVAVAHVACV